MALIVNFGIEQNCDCNGYRVTDFTNYNDYPVTSFTTRLFILTFCDGSKETYNWSFIGDDPILFVPTTKEYAASAQLILTPITTGVEVYSKTVNLAITCKLSNRASTFAKLTPSTCGDKDILNSMNELYAGIDSVKTLTRMGQLCKAQEILDYLNRKYKDCGCGCNK